jgi:hypothetical protein
MQFLQNQPLPEIPEAASSLTTTFVTHGMPIPRIHYEIDKKTRKICRVKLWQGSEGNV